MLHLSSQAARDLLLAAQGLNKRPAAPAGKDDVLNAIQRMGALQIDTIHVVARSPYLVLWSRLGDYKPEWLDELLAEGKIFEYWAHAACFLPIEDYRIYRNWMVAPNERWQRWIQGHAEVVEPVLARIREHGALRSADWERKGGPASGWWDWKPEKLALEYLFLVGEVMIARRERFQRVYDLRERVLPDWDDASALPREEAMRELVLKTVRALGVTKTRWVPDYFRLRAQGMSRLLDELVAEGKLIEVSVDGWDVPGYVHADNLLLAEDAAADRLHSELTTLLSPFDPIVWHRQRAEELFDFSYRIEVYTPAAKRRYGYFSLPILHRGALIGRLDPKAYRKEGRFVVQAVHLEPGVEIKEDLIESLARTLIDCAAWHGTPEVEVKRSDPPELASFLMSRLDLTPPTFSAARAASSPM